MDTDLVAAATRTLFFTGKGGVGKTSVSCAVAVALAGLGRQVLLVSTDPASNLDEVFATKLAGEPTPIAEVAGLEAMNVDPQAAPHYALASGYAQVSGQLGKTFASGVLYVAELSSGVLAAYSFPWNEAPRAAPITYEMHLLHHFPWRKAEKKDK
jgi:anion-transporting  ArsA/GET3 family ATPase